QHWKIGTTSGNHFNHEGHKAFHKAHEGKRGQSRFNIGKLERQAGIILTTKDTKHFTKRTKEDEDNPGSTLENWNDKRESS
ncbi:MAG TPA: hypothetical protein VFU15_13865, partial [Bacteroidia bacterium]|nr:hypothetical protein [Bacteroidia bacterium]